VFDETNGSQVEQVDLDELDDEEALCVALRNMYIGDVCPKESEEPTQSQDQPSSSKQASPPTQDEDEAREEEDEDQDNEPPQEEEIDQGGDDNNEEDEQEIQDQRLPHPRVHQAIQRDHPVNSILGDIHKGVTTRSRVAHFCEYYSFVSSIEPYRIEDALRNPDWLVAMQEELNNFTRNEV
jgi:cobalamin biosynthesis protein CobT